MNRFTRILDSRWLVAALFSALLASFYSVHAFAIDTGKVAPEISGTDAHGATVTLSKLRGKVVIIDFMASWCAPCKEELPLLNALYKRHRGQDLVVIGVSVDEKPERLKKFLSDVPVDFPVIHDAQHKAAALYSPTRMPSSFIVDKHGVIRFTHGGFHAGDEEQLEAEVSKLLQ